MNIKSLLKIVIGVGVVVFGVVLCAVFFGALKTLMLGAIGPLLILVGLVMVAVAKE